MKKRSRKQIWLAAAALALVVAFLPMVGLGGSAGDVYGPYGVIDDTTVFASETPTSHRHADHEGWIDLVAYYNDENNEDYSLLKDGSYYLSEDLEVFTTLTVEGTVVLCLNGNLLERSGGGTLLEVEDGAKLMLCDCTVDGGDDGGDDDWEDEDIDTDGDGLLDWEDEDANGDGVLDYEDADLDGIVDWEDEDANGDGILDSKDWDLDGIPDWADDDDDDDGESDEWDEDDWEDDYDGDGIPDWDDDDADNNGIPDWEELSGGDETSSDYYFERSGNGWDLVDYYTSYSIASGVVTGGSTGVAVMDGGTFELYSGAIGGNAGNGVAVTDGGTFTMYGGTVKCNGIEVCDGGGVCVAGTFDLHGGEISHNIAANGGGVYVADGASFYADGGSIINNAAIYGGGVCAAEGSAVTLEGTYDEDEDDEEYPFCRVHFNFAAYGAGIYAAEGSTVDLTADDASGGERLDLLKKNYAVNGGAIYTAGGEVTADGIAIAENRAIYDEAVFSDGPEYPDYYVYDRSFIGSALPIDPEDASEFEEGAGYEYGSGVYVESGSVTLKNSEIRDGFATWYGSGVYLKDGEFALIDSDILINNSRYGYAENCGAGAYVAGGTFTVSGLVSIFRNWDTDSCYSGLYLAPGQKLHTAEGGLVEGSRIEMSAADKPNSEGEGESAVIVDWNGIEGDARKGFLFCDTTGYTFDANCEKIILTQPPHEDENLNEFDFYDLTPYGSYYLPCGEHYYGSDDIHVASGQTLMICLNGYSVYMGEDWDPDAAPSFIVEGTLTICDCVGENMGRIENGRITVKNGGKLIMNGGRLEKGDATVCVEEGGVFEMNDGMLMNSGVELKGGAFTMNGGMIFPTGDAEYGVQVGGQEEVWDDDTDDFIPKTYDGTFTMTGGTIKGYEHGVKVESGTFTMNGGTISGNDNNGVNVIPYAIDDGNGSVSFADAEFRMEYGIISGNGDRGVDVDGGTFTMNDGEITDNGGNGVDVDSAYYDEDDEDDEEGVSREGLFTMEDGTISGNVDSGVDISDGEFTMIGGTIKDNVSNGVYISGGTFTMEDGSVSGNMEGVYIVSSAFTMNGGSLSGNNNSGARVGYEGTALITDGEITDNSIAGVRVQGGTLKMSGGEISENAKGGEFLENAETFAGGIYVFLDGTVELSGSPVIRDNYGLSTSEYVRLEEENRQPGGNWSDDPEGGGSEAYSMRSFSLQNAQIVDLSLLGSTQYLNQTPPQNESNIVLRVMESSGDGGGDMNDPHVTIGTEGLTTNDKFGVTIHYFESDITDFGTGNGVQFAKGLGNVQPFTSDDDILRVKYDNAGNAYLYSEDELFQPNDPGNTNTHNVTFHNVSFPFQGFDSVDQTIQVPHNTTVASALESPEHAALKAAIENPLRASTDFTFLGWYPTVLGSPAYDFTGHQVTGALTLNAVWTCTVKFNSNGGSAVPDDTAAREGFPLTKPTDPTKSGHTFAGWYKDAALTQAWTFGAPGVAPELVTGPMTLYAKWTETPQHSGGSVSGGGSYTPPIVDLGDPTCPCERFDDVVHDAWYEEYVGYVVESGIMNGISDTLFDPNGTTSRAEIITTLWRIEGSPMVSHPLYFSDISDGLWYIDALRWTNSENIILGYDDGRFGTDDPVTREQIATILWRYARFKGVSTDDGESASLLKFSDAKKISAYAISALRWACSEEIIQGTVDKHGNILLDPQGSATRAQIAAILMRFCENVM